MSDLTCIDHEPHGVGAFFVEASGHVGCRFVEPAFPWYWEDYCQWFDTAANCDAYKAIGFIDRGVFSPPYDSFLLSVQRQLMRPSPSPTTRPPPRTTTMPPIPTPVTPSPPSPPTNSPSNSPSPPTTTPSTAEPASTIPSSTAPSDNTPVPTVPFVTVLDPPSAKASHDWSCVNQSSVFVPVRIDASGRLECLTFNNSSDCHSLPTSSACLEWMQSYVLCVDIPPGCTNVRVKSISRQGPGEPTPSPINSTTVNGKAAGALSQPTPLNSILLGLLCAAMAVASVVGYVLWRRRRSDPRESTDSVLMLTDAPLYVTEKGRIPMLGYLNENKVKLGPPAQSPLRSTVSTQQRLTIGNQLNMGELTLWRLDHEKLTKGRTLSVGATGVVSMGMYNRIPVAIKRLHADKSLDADVAQAFIDEIKLMTKLDSPFVVSMIGCCWICPKDVELVTEYMEHGDLRNFLKNTPPTVFTWDLKRSCIHSMAQGLLYLHSMEIIHRDFKSRNVLLGKNLVAKLTDFGVSRNLSIETMTQGVGSFRWTAPEILQGKRYTEAADMYSLGMVIWELDTHEAPYVLQQGRATDCILLTKIRTHAIAPEFTAQCPADIQALVLQCIQPNPTDRPTALALATSV
ncbi:TKL protein kinase, variant [Aphanomyces invadans]|uniref:TKL protein kinase, variant n=1 Tax=Aphanomyces invadans TaxID=157072 RepID=A0A024TBI2_9STRA|nr:TKL protein kinase, variant [Aphanomyces invadans]ETV90941.1 TKL protein kinase, variant [Aphanomyces invadans]|eukprot:XP_008880423.1 TKL protein kinase, variant [Aphanomyces invadans]